MIAQVRPARSFLLLAVPFLALLACSESEPEIAERISAPPPEEEVEEELPGEEVVEAVADTPERPVPDGPNILLISMDTTRRDHLSAYGYGRKTTPVLDAIALQGVRFDKAYAPMATTAPSHASIFTSLYPLAHRVIKNGVVLDEAHDTLAEILHRHGWDTAAVVSSFVLSEPFGLAQGFDFYDDEFDTATSSFPEGTWEGKEVEGGFDRHAEATTARALDWLENERDAERPFFFFLHYFDPHWPYDPPENFKKRYGVKTEDPRKKTIGMYDGEIAYTDRQIGVVLDTIERLGLTEDTLVVILGDHGEGLGDHGHLEHGVNVYEEAVLVPLIARWPGKIRDRATRRAPVELVDLAPSILDLVGVPVEGDFQGRMISGAFRGDEKLDASRAVFLHRRHYESQVVGKTQVAGEKFAVVHGKWKLILGPDEGTKELYDIRADKKEMVNRYDEEPQEVQKLEALLQEWRARVERSGGDESEMSEETRRALEALGYTGK